MIKLSNQLLSISYKHKERFPPKLFVPMKMPGLLPIPDTMEVDEYGFLSITEEQKQQISQRNRLQRTGYGYQCRSLCRFFYHKVNSRQVSYKRTGHYYCATCEIAMKCSRCHCCSRQGRAEPKGRSKRLSQPDVKFVE